jgi:hypothetical protein
MAKSKNVILLLVLVIVVTALGYLAFTTNSPLNSSPTLYSTTPSPTISAAQTPKVSPQIIDITPYESCQTTADCTPAKLIGIDNPNNSAVLCLNTSILTAHPTYALSTQAKAELAQEASCDCLNNSCSFTLK